MGEYEQQIAFYCTGFYICMGIMIAAFALAAVFFFRFRIRKLFSGMNGKADIAGMMDHYRASTGSAESKADITGMRAPANTIYAAGMSKIDITEMPETGILHNFHETDPAEAGITEKLNVRFEVFEHIVIVHSEEII